jgi:hypothetical protein
VSGARGIGIALLLLAVAVYAAVTSPADEAAAEARTQTERLVRERQDGAGKLADIERRAAFLGRAAALMNQPAAARGDESIQRVRAGIVRSLRDMHVSHVRLEVRPAPGPAIAAVALSAEGGFFELLRLIAQLNRPGSGLVLQHVTMSGAPYTLAFDAVAIGAAP